MINGIFSLFPTSCSILWSVGLKAFILVLIIVCLVVLISWLITEFIWRKKNLSPAPEEDTDVEEDEEIVKEDTDTDAETDTNTETEENNENN